MNQPLFCITALDLILIVVFLVCNFWGAALSTGEPNWRTLRFWKVMVIYTIAALAFQYPIASRLSRLN